jgi:hypothetical protein
MKRFTFILCLISSTCFSQNGEFISNGFHENRIPKKPDAASLGSFGNVPVNYYTGLPDITVPLLSLSSGELSLPVSLQYNSAGVRVDEISGPVGLNWTLNAGGYVARSLNGIPDEDPTHGYLKYSSETDYYAESVTDQFSWAYDIQNKIRDAEPDEFTVVLPGRSLKFVFDKYGQAICVPRQNVSISKTIVNGKIERFTIIDENGVTYIFGDDTDAIEQRKIESFTFPIKIGYDFITHNGVVRYTGNDRFVSDFDGWLDIGTFGEKTIPFHNSKWYLISMESPVGDWISFDYQKNVTDLKYAGQPSVTRIGTVNVKLEQDGHGLNNTFAVREFGTTDPGSAPYPSSLGSIPPSQTDSYFEAYQANAGGAIGSHSVITESNITLAEIECSTGAKIVMGKSSGREDLPGAFKYDYLYEYNADGQGVRTLKLNYATVSASETDDYMWPSEGVMLYKSNFPETGYLYANFAKSKGDAMVANVKLKKYVFEGLKGYNYKRLFLESIDEISGTFVLRKNSFSYNMRDQMKRRTSPLFGAYGYSTQAVEPHNFWIKNNTWVWTANCLNPAAGKGTEDPVGPKIGLLTSITYATLGRTEFQYIVNQGNHLSSISDIDENGVIISQKQIEFEDEGFDKNGPIYVSYQDFKVDGSNKWIKNLVRSSSPQNAYWYTKGSPLGFGQVKVYHGTSTTHNGYEIFYYSGNIGLQAVPIVDRDGYGLATTDVPTEVRTTPTNIDDEIFQNKGTIPFARSTNNDHLRGLLLRHEIFDKDGILVKKSDNHYRVNPNLYFPDNVYGLSAASYVYSSEDETSFWEGRYTEPVTRKRVGRYKISSDWLVLEKTQEYFYDQNDANKVITKSTTYSYDKANMQLVEVRTNQLDDPSTQIVSKTKYPTHTDYAYPKTCVVNYNNCVAACSGDGSARCVRLCEQSLNSCVDYSGLPETDALTRFRKIHLVNTPIESQKYLEQNSVSRLVNATVSKFTLVGGKTWIKPSGIWLLNKPQTSGEYIESKVNSSGEFTTDVASKMRKVQTYENFDLVTGRLLSESSLGGIPTTYAWGHNNSLIVSQTVNPGIYQHTSTFSHRPSVGVTAITDANQISTQFEFDGFNRLKYVKDYNGHIMSRHRYHYKSDNESMLATLAFSGNQTANGTATISVTHNPTEFGQTSYQWDFGDGAQTTNTSNLTYHSYSSAGTFQVKVTVTNPEYGSSSASQPITINPVLSAQVCVDGPQSGDRCIAGTITYGDCTVSADQWSPTFFKVNTSGGCSGTQTYEWKYYTAQYPSGQIFGGSYSQVQAPPVVGEYTVKCRVIDGCGTEFTTSEIYVNLTQSNCDQN